MSCSVEKKADFLVYEISDSLNIFCISEVYETMCEQENGSNKIIIDLSNVTEMDSSGFQLLLWFKQKFSLVSEVTFSYTSDGPIQSICDLYRVYLDDNDESSELN